MTDIRRRTQNPGAQHGTEVAEDDRGGDGSASILAEAAVVRRTKDGWRVGGADLPDLTSAMVLADLISAELAAAAGPLGAAHAGQTASGPAAPGPAASGPAETGPNAPGEVGARADGPTNQAAATETSKLRATIGQLEHALSARIRVEQAIGVLAERHRIQPRQAFEQLREAARSRGRRVIDIASDVVASATNPLLQLPDELSRPRPGRKSRRPRGVLGSE